MFRKKPSPVGLLDAWVPLAEEKRQRCAASIPHAWQLPKDVWNHVRLPLAERKNDLIALDVIRTSRILTPEELEITEAYTTDGLLQRLAKGILTSADVTRAFSKRAAVAQQLTGCLTETFFDQAAARAQHLDKMRESGILAGPLHGLPVSLKDSFQVEGTEATLGLVAYLGKISDTNSPLVDILLSLGAVIYVKTNIPQTLMAPDSDNNIFGRVLNPNNTALGAGGSSGGEGALLAMRGSPLGVGTDIAGSIRIPALCCGTYGFKPTSSRVPYGQQREAIDEGRRFIRAAAGPLANDLAALRLFMTHIIGARPAEYDSSAIDVPWRALPDLSKKTLRIGVLAEDPCFPCQPPIKQAVLQASLKIRSSGHTIINLAAEEGHVAELNGVAWGIFGLDNTGERLVTDAGEPFIPGKLHIEREVERANCKFEPDTPNPDGLERLSLLYKKQTEYKESWRKLWQNHRLDAIIAPSAQGTAVIHDKFGHAPYTAFLNVLDYPACVVPTGRASHSDGDIYSLGARQIGPPYDPKLVEGAPCSIQIFTSAMRDEECLAVASILDKVLNPSISS